VPTGRFEERQLIGSEPGYVEPKLLSAATAPVPTVAPPNPPGAPSNRRRATRYGLGALLVLALFSALLLRCGDSTTSHDKSASRAGPKADRGSAAARAPQNGSASAAGNIAVGTFEVPPLPTSGPASDFTGSAFASLPGAAPGAVTPPVQYAPPTQPGPTQVPLSPQPTPTPGPHDVAGSV